MMKTTNFALKKRLDHLIILDNIMFPEITALITSDIIKKPKISCNNSAWLNSMKSMLNDHISYQFWYKKKLPFKLKSLQYYELRHNCINFYIKYKINQQPWSRTLFYYVSLLLGIFLAFISSLTNFYFHSIIYPSHLHSYNNFN